MAAQMEQDNETRAMQHAMLASYGSSRPRDGAAVAQISPSNTHKRPREVGDAGDDFISSSRRGPSDFRRALEEEQAVLMQTDDVEEDYMLRRMCLLWDDVDTQLRLDPETQMDCISWRDVARAMSRTPEIFQVQPRLAARLSALARGEDARSASSASGPVPAVERCDDLLERFRDGGIRKARTPGRGELQEANCVSPDEFIRLESIVSMFHNTYILEWDLLADLIPVFGSGPHSQRNTPIYLSQEIHADMLRRLACKRIGIEDANNGRGKFKKGDQALLDAELYKLWQKVAGPNLHAAHPYAGGIDHSKVFVVKYPSFLLVAITSCNTMKIDMELADNHWYIQTFPKLPKHERRDAPSTEFEDQLLAHMSALACPDVFVDKIRGKYDYSATVDRVHLVPSTPNAKYDDSHGAFRLNALARQLIPRKERHDVELEMCCGSVGRIDKYEWIVRMDRLLRGREPQRTVDKDIQEMEIPKWTVVYPTRKTVHACSDEVKSAASNIGCTVNNDIFADAPIEVRAMFHDYESLDRGRLFHEKLILFKRPAPSSLPPYLVYFGSHNLSQAAWGYPEPGTELERKRSTNPHMRKLSATKNFELGVVIAGEHIASMLEPGSRGWEDMLTYVRPPRPYRSGEVPWNSEAWVRHKQE
ncbi:hypothetical protein Rhopal_007789-T1 [Rhodotorula paludigena]|uniref:Uncharacterized protein n=1 Tax=Rhodotorula paludigena TaxID=86838 RepID=A0AAV5GWV2_9BASI|nr:hypothetical protein Rhopal_007789-T1 [Rhodotorula paludigena]